MYKASFYMYLFMRSARRSTAGALMARATLPFIRLHKKIKWMICLYWVEACVYKQDLYVTQFMDVA